MHSFCANVDQYVRILHKPTILIQLNHLRRGILVEADDFVCQLSAVYNLSLLSLSDEDCMRTVGELREALLMRFKSDVEKGLGRQCHDLSQVVVPTDLASAYSKSIHQISLEARLTLVC